MQTFAATFLIRLNKPQNYESEESTNNDKYGKKYAIIEKIIFIPNMDFLILCWSSAWICPGFPFGWPGDRLF
ncbi:MAG TPA: hypothetical protein VEI57_14550 [Nitrospirota bacterium]|nr:hypothetical protein [Nitrospirota bacterium]